MLGVLQRVEGFSPTRLAGIEVLVEVFVLFLRGQLLYRTCYVGLLRISRNLCS